MKIQQAREVATKALGNLADSVRQGQTEVFRNYLAAMGKCHRYSPTNILLIRQSAPRCRARRRLPNMAEASPPGHARRQGHRHLCDSHETFCILQRPRAKFTIPNKKYIPVTVPIFWPVLC
jgi:hypothetical protein